MDLIQEQEQTMTDLPQTTVVTADQLTPSQRRAAERFVRSAIDNRFLDLPFNSRGHLSRTLDLSDLSTEALNAQIEGLGSEYHFKEVKLIGSGNFVQVVLRVGRVTAVNYSLTEHHGALIIGKNGGVRAFPSHRKSAVRGWKAYIYAWH